MRTVRGQSSLTAAVDRWYRPAIDQAWTKAIGQARPDRAAKWRRYVLDAASEIRRYLFGLNERLNKAAGSGSK